MKLNVKAEFDGAYRPVGTIETRPGVGAVFSYEEEWVENIPHRPLSLSIPIGEVEYSDRDIRPYFEGLLPEEYLPLGAAVATLARKRRTPALANEFTADGKECAAN